jgi:aspartate 1-decarboxylase
MLLTMLTGKIHRATVTEAHLDYEGSISVDGGLLDAAHVRPFERVEVYNVIIAAYGQMAPAEADDHRPHVVLVDRADRIREHRHAESPSTITVWDIGNGAYRRPEPE